MTRIHYLIFLSWAFLIPTRGAELPTFRFDLGTQTSAVAPGFTRITPESRYAAGGFGWVSSAQTAFDVLRPAENPAWKGPGSQLIPQDFVIYKEHSDLTRDGVSSLEDLTFRVDLPNGIYRVAVTLGHLEKPICSQQIWINGALAAEDLHAKHVARRSGADHQYGFPLKVRRTVRVDSGSLTVRIHGDDSAFRARFLEEFEKPVPISYLVGAPFRVTKPDKPDLSLWGKPRRGGPEIWVWEDIGGPFTENSILALEVYPYQVPPLRREAGALRAEGGDPRLSRAVDLFNAGQLAEAESAFQSVQDPYARALGLLWLAGHPNYEEERRLLPEALRILKQIEPSHSSDLAFAEVLESAQALQRALDRFDHRADQQRTYIELLLISGEVASLQPEDPTYYKGMIYAARGLYMVIPHRWSFSAGAGRRILEKVRRDGFGDNRYVRWYLDEVWSSDAPDWSFPDYSAGQAGAPAWAAAVYEAYNRELDLAEWWIRNRQAEDGSLGGGWGDDVEILRSFGTFGSICPDASPLILEGTRKVANGAWNSGSVDTEAGYFAEVGDTEHSGEWTADTLVPMIRIDYGNPLFVERAMKTARLMRDLWMARNRAGHFLIQSNFLGALGVGTGLRRNESRINYRPAAPARAVLGYNGLPTLQKMFLDWADGWLAASLSTDRGKPRGIIPQEIGFDDNLIGGANSPSWYEADNSPGTVNYDWEGVGSYHDAIVDLFLLAYELSGDAKYLEPMQLEAAYVRENCPPEILQKASAGPINPRALPLQSLEKGSSAWIAGWLSPWPAQWEKIQRIKFPERYGESNQLWTLEQITKNAAQEVEGARRRWPHVTTECIATDRVYWPGMTSALRLMTGIGIIGFDPLVTYRGLGREFAAALLHADDSSMRILLYSTAQEARDAAVVPWLLEPGAEYRLKIGPDTDQDQRPDSVAEERVERLDYRGQELEFRMPPRQTFVLEVTRVSSVRPAGPTADAALSTADVRFSPEFRRVEVTVHNIGSASLRDAEVVVWADGREVGRHSIPNIEAPLQFDPQTVRIGLPFVPTAGSHRFEVEVRLPSGSREINRRNNRVEVTLDTPLRPRMQHSHP